MLKNMLSTNVYFFVFSRDAIFWAVQLKCSCCSTLTVVVRLQLERATTSQWPGESNAPQVVLLQVATMSDRHLCMLLQQCVSLAKHPIRNTQAGLDIHVGLMLLLVEGAGLGCWTPQLLSSTRRVGLPTVTSRTGVSSPISTVPAM